MSLSDRLERLTPEQRALLGAMLAAKAAAPAASSRIPARKPSDPRPLSFGQERFWFLDRVSPESPLYTFGAHFHVAGFVDARALEQSLGEVLARHEVLRTRITEERGDPVQIAPRVDDFRLEEVRLDTLRSERSAPPKPRESWRVSLVSCSTSGAIRSSARRWSTSVTPSTCCC